MQVTKKLGNRKLIILMIVGAIAVFAFIFIFNVKTAQAGDFTCYGEGGSATCFNDYWCWAPSCSQECSGGTTVELCAYCVRATWACVYTGWWPPIPICWWVCHTQDPACTYINCADRNYVGDWVYGCRPGDKVWRQRWREDWSCSGGACQVNAYVEGEDVEDCDSRDRQFEWDYFCDGDTLRRRRWIEDWYCSGGGCSVNAYSIHETVENCGSTSYSSWSYYCSGRRLYRRRTIYNRGCSGTSCYYYTSTQTEYVQNCGSTSYGSWSYYCYNNDRYRRRTVYNRGCSGTSCYDYTSTQTEFIQDCGSTSYSSWSYYCSGSRLYRTRTVYNRGCSGSSCYDYTSTQTEYVQECGSTSYGSWSYYCSGDNAWRRRTIYNRGCSGTSCYYYTSTQNEFIQACGSDYCDAWSNNYCKNNDIYRQRTCYDKGCSGGSCYNNPWTDEPLVQNCNDATEQCVADGPNVWCESRPSASNLSVNEGDYCTVPLRPIFSWTFSDPEGDSQGAYQIQVDNNSNFSSPEVDSGKVSSASEAYAPIGGLSYNTTYYWRVKVWDEHDSQSNWISGSSFATPLHAYPDPDFNWFPDSPTEGELIRFCTTQEAGVCSSDESTCYDIGGAIPSPSCSGKTFLWTFPGGTEFATGTSPTSENPRVKFGSTGAKDVSLEITDDIASCTRLKTVGVMWPLPKWKEIAPF